ncbi:TetR/AcrR family transcriptional regulator [Sinimarinibacterium thermocellulolyticum]|uniref:TetR/AcrR family transcriptional regulator n=1 Tax=Sinimarinibacterium thermocellulolyticum TaxID=3170016 RepID=A0ABV2AAI3_9GAMM
MPRRPAHEQFDALKAIQDCAFELFGRYGYEGVSIGDIAKAAKLSKGALYWHFQGKQALYLDCLRRLHAIFHAYILDPVRLEPEPVRALLCLFTGLQRMLQDPRIESGVAGYWLTPSTPQTAAIIDTQRAFESLAVKTLRDAMQRGADSGLLDFAGDLDTLARAIVSLIEACVLPLRHQSPDEVRSLLGVLARTLFRAYALSDELTAAAEQALRPSSPRRPTR